MADVYPFAAYRYSPAAGRLEDLITQPYDKITPEMQRRYLSLHPYNLVRIELGEQFADDTAENNVYTRAASYLKEWIENGVLVRDERPGFYAYFQEFRLPESDERLLRKGFIGLLPVEDYSAGTVYRHEHTLSGPKQDRLELLRHIRMHFGQIFLLYPDAEARVEEILDEVSMREPLATVKDEYGTVHTLWQIVEPAWVAAIRHHMTDKKLVIADGHHRYETALAFKKENPQLEDAKLVMATFVNLYSPGLRILATHRLVDGADPEKFLRLARSQFRVRQATDMEDLRAAMEEAGSSEVARIGVACRERGLYLLEVPKQEEDLDVAVLHGQILEGLLGITAEEVRNERGIRYVRGMDAAVSEVRQGRAALAFLLRPVSVHEVARVAFSGGVMPQKSTDFYPKLLSGLTGYRLEK